MDMDTSKPDRIVRQTTPPGGINAMRVAFEEGNEQRGKIDGGKNQSWGKTDCFLFLRTNAHWLLDMCLEQRLRPWKYTFNRNHYHSIICFLFLSHPSVSVGKRKTCRKCHRLGLISISKRSQPRDLHIDMCLLCGLWAATRHDSSQTMLWPRKRFEYFIGHMAVCQLSDKILPPQQMRGGCDSKSLLKSGLSWKWISH